MKGGGGDVGIVQESVAWKGPMEHLSFSIGQISSLNQKTKTSMRKGQGKMGRPHKSGGSQVLGAKRKNKGECDSMMDGDDVDMEAVGEGVKRLRMTDTNDGEDIPLTVAEVGLDQPREDQ